jgi:hypothetical protein
VDVGAAVFGALDALLLTACVEHAVIARAAAIRKASRKCTAVTPEWGGRQRPTVVPGVQRDDRIPESLQRYSVEITRILALGTGKFGRTVWLRPE